MPFEGHDWYDPMKAAIPRTYAASGVSLLRSVLLGAFVLAAEDCGMKTTGCYKSAAASGTSSAEAPDQHSLSRHAWPPRQHAVMQERNADTEMTRRQAPLRRSRRVFKCFHCGTAAACQWLRVTHCAAQQRHGRCCACVSCFSSPPCAAAGAGGSGAGGCSGDVLQATGLVAVTVTVAVICCSRRLACTRGSRI